MDLETTATKVSRIIAFRIPPTHFERFGLPTTVNEPTAP